MDSLERLTQADATGRLAVRDPSLFSADPYTQAEIAPWMGWVGLAMDSGGVAAAAQALAGQLLAEGFTDVVLLGMGGSSLASIVLSRVFGTMPGGARLHVLDTTSPSAVLAVAGTLPLVTTVVLVSSKSGGTIEPMSMYAILRERFDNALGRQQAGVRFIALTDPGSGLESLAVAEGFRAVVHTPADVGGRYSALTAFHLLPAALLGLDVGELMRRAAAMDEACRAEGPANPAAPLAAFMADGVAAGRDKLVLIGSRGLAPLGLWLEQLIAESLGKSGRGIVPIAATGPETLIGADPDRMVVLIRFAGDDGLLAATQANALGAPVLDIVINAPYDVAAEFVRWEYATALTGALIGVNPFDQPNVAEAKAATEAILSGALTAPTGAARLEQYEVFSSGLAPASTQLDDLAFSVLASLAAGDYLAVLAYVPEVDELIAPLQTAVNAASWATGKAATLELGPRYLHSTGQLHKGGPPTGAFIIVSGAEGPDAAIPGRPYTLRGLMRAQALGDFATLSARGSRVVLLEFTHTTGADIADLASAIAQAAAGILAIRRQATTTLTTDATAPSASSTTATQ